MTRNSSFMIITIIILCLGFYYLGYSIGNAHVLPFIDISKCDNNSELECFGSGRSNYIETDSAGIWNLITTEGLLRFGLVDKNTGGLYILEIK